jgi:hypothetical protein
VIRLSSFTIAPPKLDGDWINLKRGDYRRTASAVANNDRCSDLECGDLSPLSKAIVRGPKR